MFSETRSDTSASRPKRCAKFSSEICGDMSQGRADARRGTLQKHYNGFVSQACTALQRLRATAAALALFPFDWARRKRTRRRVPNSHGSKQHASRGQQRRSSTCESPRTHPGLVELIRHATRVCEDDLPVADDQQQEQGMKAHQQDDAGRRVDAPQRECREEDEAVVHERDDHKNHDRDEEEPAGADLIAPFIRCHALPPPGGPQSPSRSHPNASPGPLQRRSSSLVFLFFHHVTVRWIFETFLNTFPSLPGRGCVKRVKDSEQCTQCIQICRG